MHLIDHIKENLEIIVENQQLNLPNSSDIIRSQGMFSIEFNIDSYAKFINFGKLQYNIIDASNLGMAEKFYNRSKPIIKYVIKNHTHIINRIYDNYDRNFIDGEDKKYYPSLRKPKFLDSIFISGIGINVRGLQVHYLFNSRVYDQVTSTVEISHNFKITNISMGVM